MRTAVPFAREDRRLQVEPAPQLHSLVLRSTVAPAVLDDGAVLLDLESKFFYELNRSGWAIASMFETGATSADVEHQCAAWGCDDLDEVRRFVSQLEEYDLLVRSERPSAGWKPAAQRGPWTPPTIERQLEPLQNVIVSAFDPSIPLAE
jgi:hypothetical protein